MYKIDSREVKPSAERLLRRMEKEMEVGVRLGDLPQLTTIFGEEYKRIRKYIQDIYGIADPDSSKCVVSFMKRMNDPVLYQVAYEGKWGTNKKILKRLSDLGYVFADDLIYFRKVLNAVRTLKSLSGKVGKDGLVHPKVKLVSTNRIHFVEPNIIGIPNSLLKHLVRPREEGMKLYSVDIKNQEPFIVANVMGIEKMKEILREGKGLYEQLFSMIFQPKATVYVHHKEGGEYRIIQDSELMDQEHISPRYYRPSRPFTQEVYYNNDRIILLEKTNLEMGLSGQCELPEKVRVQGESGRVYNLPVEWDNQRWGRKKSDSIRLVQGNIQGLDVRCKGEERKMFKVIWNAVMYGMARVSTAEMFPEFHGEVIYDFIQGMPEVKKYKKAVREKMKSEPGVVYTYFGTRLTLGSNAHMGGIIDFPIQGTGADILALLVENFDKEVEKRGLAGKLSLYYTRHDEVVVQVSEEIENVEGLLKELFEHQVDDWEPFRVDVEEMVYQEMKVDRQEMQEEEEEVA